MEILAAQLIELGVSQGPEAPPRPNRQHKGPAATSTSNSVQPAGGNDQNNKQMPQSSSILDQVSDWSHWRDHDRYISAAKLNLRLHPCFFSLSVSLLHLLSYSRFSLRVTRVKNIALRSSSR